MQYKKTAKELRKDWLNYYINNGHVDIGAVSLLGDGDTGVLFNVAGMQPLMPYLLGEKKHPSGKTRLCNIQGCVRTVDIEEVGDNRHFTFFEMMGNWSLGDYFKKEKTKWSFDLLTRVFGYDKNKIFNTVFAGDENAPRDEETANYLIEAGQVKDHIFYKPAKDNWWGLPGTVNTPCGPDDEWFYETDKPKCGNGCDPSCGCGHFIEIGNDVYMQYKALEGGKYEELKNKNVDTGFGFERNLAFLNGTDDAYKTDLFVQAIAYLESLTGIKYGVDEKVTKAYRIICDHIRTSVMLLADEKLLKPSNVSQGYILRRLIRRAIRYTKILNLPEGTIVQVAKSFIDGDYYKDFENIKTHKQIVLEELTLEEEKFSKTIDSGLKEFNKLIQNLIKFAPNVKQISGEKAFKLFDTFGFPLEMTAELAAENNFTVDKDGFEKAFALHREKSGAGSTGVFKGGLSNSGEETAKLHTATHLLHNALIKVLGSGCKQMGSNINEERLRFDFAFNRKLENEELEKIEKTVNEAINKKIPVVKTISTVEEAKKSGAIGVFDSKYGDEISVYAINGYGAEICGGPHAQNTADLGKFKIVKEESSSSGVRRIKAILEK